MSCKVFDMRPIFEKCDTYFPLHNEPPELQIFYKEYIWEHFLLGKNKWLEMITLAGSTKCFDIEITILSKSHENYSTKSKMFPALFHNRPIFLGIDFDILDIHSGFRAHQGPFFKPSNKTATPLMHQTLLAWMSSQHWSHFFWHELRTDSSLCVFDWVDSRHMH